MTQWNTRGCITAFFALVAAIAFAPVATAQFEPGKVAPSVILAPPAMVTIPAGTAGSVELRFRIGSGFHINSNTPKSEFLIPTALKLEPPTDIAVGKISYPPGEDISLPFQPDEKLNVYSGEFALQVEVHPLHTVVPGTYKLHGTLKYQACDKAACYPPKQLPLEFELKVARGAAHTPKKNPAQSPHAHS